MDRIRAHDGEGGLSTTIGLVAMAVGMGVLAVLLLIGMGTFTGGAGAPSAQSSIFSRSTTESQIKLCAEGRNSSYGDPPTPAQQAKCLNELAGQIAPGG
ncbi:MAG TPA: hypothetical protein VN799_05025 [Acidimicrobiales bacterium]|nr:hypothetical protein [Acidimicrobiales bacterium]